jgi:hypothetical protein
MHDWHDFLIAGYFPFLPFLSQIDLKLPVTTQNFLRFIAVNPDQLVLKYVIRKVLVLRNVLFLIDLSKYMTKIYNIG